VLAAFTVLLAYRRPMAPSSKSPAEEIEGGGAYMSCGGAPFVGGPLPDSALRISGIDALWAVANMKVQTTP